MSRRNLVGKIEKKEKGKHFSVFEKTACEGCSGGGQKGARNGGSTNRTDTKHQKNRTIN